MLDRLETMEKRENEIDQELMNPIDFSRAKILNQERAGLDEAVTLYKQYKKIKKDLEEAEAMEKDEDPDLAEMGKEEAARNLPVLKALNFTELLKNWNVSGGW